MLADALDRLVASDPGLNRLRTAGRGVVSMGSALGLERLFAGYTGAGTRGALIAMLLGAIVGMLGSLGLSAGTRVDRALTALTFPPAIGIGMTIGAAVSTDTDLLLGVFVVVLFVAVYIRRFGQRFFFAGFMIWLGYFFASFLGATYGELPRLVSDTALAAAWVLLLSLTVLHGNSARTLRTTLRAFTSRAQSVAEAAADLLTRDTRKARRRLARQQRRLDESALLIEGQLADGAAAGPRSAAELRRLLVDAQLAVDELALATQRVVRESPTADASGLRAVLRLFAGGRVANAARMAHELESRLDGADEELRRAVRRTAAAVVEYARCVERWSQPADVDEADAETFEPSVTTPMGNLPSSAAVVGQVEARGASWNPLARLPLTTRQAIQVALAGGLAIAAGRALSEQRYYWAVIAAFITFTGTATRAETFLKASNRVIGTAAGLGVAIVLANLTAGSDWAALTVILGSIFFGFYLRQVSYAYMIFFITIMVAQLYSVLHEFTDALLVLRLEETGIGAGAGVLVGLFVLPLDTRDASRLARGNLYEGLAELLRAAADRLGGSDDSAHDDLDRLARTIDGHLHQLRQILQPLTNPLALRSDGDRIRERISLYTLAASTARRVASAARRATETAPERLAEAAGALADASEALADRTRTPGPEQSFERARDGLDAARDAAPADAREPLEHALTRLLVVLRRLAERSPPHEGRTTAT